MRPMEKPSLIVVCDHCAGQFRVQNSAIPDTENRVRCPICLKDISMNSDPEPGSEPLNAPGSKEAAPAYGSAPELRADDRGIGGETGNSAKGSSERLEAARNAVDDLLTPVPKRSRRKSPPPPKAKPARRKSSPPPKAKPARRQYPPLPPPSQRSPQQPVRPVPQPQDPPAAPSPDVSPPEYAEPAARLAEASPPEYAEPAAPLAEASPVASETPAERVAALLGIARDGLQSGLEALAPWITAAAEMPVAAKVGGAALLLGLLGAVAYWPDGNSLGPLERAARITRPAAATTGLVPEANPRSWGQAGASQPHSTRRPGPMGRWTGAVEGLEETEPAPETPEAIAPRAAPATKRTAAAPPPTVKTAADVAPAKAAPPASPQTKTVKTPAAKPPPALKAPAKVAVTSGPETTTAKPQPRSTDKVLSTATTKPSAVSTTRLPTRRPGTVTRRPVSQKTISSGSANSQKQGESGWVIEY